jgi:hypothetical protein
MVLGELWIGDVHAVEAGHPGRYGDDGRPAGDLLHTPASVWLAVFGYHEVFHLLVIAGVAAHVLAISRLAVPTRVNSPCGTGVGDE